MLPGQAAGRVGSARWMSDVQALARELAALRLQVASQELRLAALEQQLPVPASSASQGSFEVVASPRGSVTEFSAAASADPVRASAPASGTATSRAALPLVPLASLPASISSPDIESRAALARHIGHFVNRALRGEFRGNSGRERLALASRLYLVFALHSGEHCNPPIVCFSWSAAKDLCKRGSSAGQAVFVGLASEWEARIVLETASFSWEQCHERR